MTPVKRAASPARLATGLALAAAAGLAGAVRADDGDLRPWVIEARVGANGNHLDTAALGMKSLLTSIGDREAFFMGAPGWSGSYGAFNASGNVSLSVGRRLSRHAGIGVRLENLAGGPVTGSVYVDGAAGEHYEESITFDLSDTELLAGAWVETEPLSWLTLRGQAFIGTGGLTVTSTFAATHDIPALGYARSDSGSAEAKGGSLAELFAFDVGLEPFSWLTVYFTLDYHLANVVATTFTQDLPAFGIANGDGLNDPSGLPIPFDLSGFGFSFGLAVSL